MNVMPHANYGRNFRKEKFEIYSKSTFMDWGWFTLFHFLVFPLVCFPTLLDIIDIYHCQFNMYNVMI